MSGWPQPPPRQGHAVGRRVPPISRSGSESGNRVTRAGRGFPSHWTPSRHFEAPPPSPRGGGRRFLIPASPPSPPGGGGRRCFIPASPRCNRRLCQPRSSACGGSESGVDAARAGSQSLSWYLCRLAPVDGDGSWASPCREGQPGQLRSSAARLCGTVSSPAANRSALSVAPTSELSRTPREGAKQPDPLTEAGPCPGAQGALGALGAVGACAGPWGTALGPSIMSPRPAPASAAAAAAAQLVTDSAPATLPQTAGEAT